MIQNQFRLIVRDRICMSRQQTDDDLKTMNCFYESPVFSWDGSLSSLDTIIDVLQKDFNHFIDWTATVVPA